VFPVSDDRELDSLFALVLGHGLLYESVIAVGIRLLKEDKVGKDGWVAILAGDALEALFVELGHVDVDTDGHMIRS